MLQTNYYFQRVVYIWAILKKAERFKGSLMFKLMVDIDKSSQICIIRISYPFNIITFYLATLCETCFC